MSSQPDRRPLLLDFDGISPRFAAPLDFCGQNVSILGKVTLGAGAAIGAGAVIRADGDVVRIGDAFSIGAMSTVHIAHETYPAIVGDNVSVGRNTVVHACTIGDNCVIEDDVVVLDGAIVEDNVVIEQGATVFPRSVLTQGFVYAGSPAKPQREATPDERAERGARLRVAASDPAIAVEAGSQAARFTKTPDVFIAQSAYVAGRVECEEHSSVFFGCRLNAGNAVISIGANTNIQDNTTILGGARGVAIGANSVIGHNVVMRECSVGARSLVGIGANMAEGTSLGDDALLAAGATTLPGQELAGGMLWGGRPARIIGRLDTGKQKMIAGTVHHYRIYAEAFRIAQEKLA